MRAWIFIITAGLLSGCSENRSPIAPSVVESPAAITQAQGDWIPVLGGSEGTNGQTYHSQHGEWVKTGPLVFASATITLIVKGTIQGHVEIQGLPFPSAAAHDSACAFGDFDAAGTELVWVAGIIGSGSSVVTLRQRNSAARSMSPMTTADIANDTALEMSCVYITS